MNSKNLLNESFKRILWLEKEMKENYAVYKKLLFDEELKGVLGEIEQDEARHINIAENIISILQK